MKSISTRIADELNIRESQVDAAIGLLDEGSTVPFISRYRKEVTGGLDDTQMRTLEERLRYLRELEARRVAILKSIEDQGKLNPKLAADIHSADTKNRLEDLYLPYKTKRRSKGQIAREAGLEPLANALFDNPELSPELEAVKYIVGGTCNPVNPAEAAELDDETKKIVDVKTALDGAKFILIERFSENAELVGSLRELLKSNGSATARVFEDKKLEAAKFQDYFAYSEPLHKVPSHRALAIFRGRNEGFLSLSISVGDASDPTATHPCESMIAHFWRVTNQNRPADKWLDEVVRWTWRVKLSMKLEMDLLGELRERAEKEAINVFASNMKDLLLAAPAGQKATIGLDPGLRTGCKVAVVDATGKVVDHCAIYPTPPRNQAREAELILIKLCKQHNVGLIAIGNGTASRETDNFVGNVLKANKDIHAQKVMVNEAGASVYSASEFAAKEFPDLDVTIRGAISIARRLQDPLAELVKIDPKSIGVGQYQHDVSQTQLARSLNTVVEDCVNAVGVEVNTASAPLLAAVSGLNPTIANNIVEFRDQNGAFASREALKSVPRLGAKTFEQAAGFLRVANGETPLDSSAVHPESYSIVEQIAKKNNRPIQKLLGDSLFLKSLVPADYTNDQFGIPTVTDIISELDKPGRDPRPDFKTAQFKEGIEKISDLEPGLMLEGTVTNVTNFGAFVDIGVHQDGLVHISALSNTFVKDPREVVKAGDIVKVKVMQVDAARKRIAMSMRLDDEIDGAEEERPTRNDARRGSQRSKQKDYKLAATQSSTKHDKPPEGTMAALFAKANEKNKNK